MIANFQVSFYFQIRDGIPRSQLVNLNKLHISIELMYSRSTAQPATQRLIDVAGYSGGKPFF